MRKSFVKAREHWPPHGLVNFPKALLLMATSDPLWNTKKTPLTQTYPFLSPTHTIAASTSNQPLTRGVFRSRGRGYPFNRGKGNTTSNERTSKCHLFQAPPPPSNLLARCVHRPETVPPGTCVACGGAYRKAYCYNAADRVSILPSDHLPPLQRDWAYKKIQCSNQLAGAKSPATQAYLQKFEVQISWEPEDWQDTPPHMEISLNPPLNELDTKCREIFDTEIDGVFNDYHLCS